MSKEITTITPLMEAIVDKKVAGKSIETISAELSIPVSEVKKILNKKDTKNLINTVIINTSSSIVAKHVDTISKIIDSKLEKLAEAGDDLDKATKKDIVDLVQMLNNISTSKEKVDKDDDNGGTYINILNGILT